jgi:hypothetical protein
MTAEEGSGDDSAEDRDYERLLGRSASRGSRPRGAQGSPLASPAAATAGAGEAAAGSPKRAVANGSTPLSSVKASLDDLDTEAGAGSPSNIPPGAPGYIEPGSTPDKSVHDKIRLFAQRSATGQPHNHKELFGGSGRANSAQDAAGDGSKRRRPDDDSDTGPSSRPPKPRQVEQLVRASRAEQVVPRKRGVRDVKSRGRSADGQSAAAPGGGTAAAAAPATPSGKSDSKAAAGDNSGAKAATKSAERLVASPRPPTWMCRVVVTAVEVREVPRMPGEVMTDCACQVSLNAPGAATVSNCTKLVRSSGHEKGVKWKERMVFGLQEELAPSASLAVELVGRSVADPSRQKTFGRVREFRIAELLDQVMISPLRDVLCLPCPADTRYPAPLLSAV